MQKRSFLRGPMSCLKAGLTDASCFSRIRESLVFSRSMWPCDPRGMTHRSWILPSTRTYTFCATFVQWRRQVRFLYFTLINTSSNTSSCHLFNHLLFHTVRGDPKLVVAINKDRGSFCFYSDFIQSSLPSSTSTSFWFWSGRGWREKSLSSPTSFWFGGLAGEIRHNQAISCQEGKPELNPCCCWKINTTTTHPPSIHPPHPPTRATKSPKSKQFPQQCPFQGKS